MTTVLARIAPRADTAANFTAANPVLVLREMARETDTGKIKFGDGATAWNSLPYWAPATDPEVVRDTIGAALVASGLVTLTVNDGADTITIGVDSAAVAELARDTLGTALTAGAGITIAPNDGADTITIAIDTAVIDERARDALGAALTAGLGTKIVADDAGDTITVRAGAAAPYTGASGQFHINAANASSMSTLTVTANQANYYPVIPLAEDRTIVGLAVYVTTGVAGAKARVSLHSDVGGKPDGGALLADSGDLDCSTTNTQQVGTVSYVMEAGKRYWLRVNTRGTGMALRSITAAGTMVLPVAGLDAANPVNLRRATETYGAPPATVPATSVNTGQHVAVGMKV